MPDTVAPQQIWAGRDGSSRRFLVLRVHDGFAHGWLYQQHLATTWDRSMPLQELLTVFRLAEDTPAHLRRKGTPMTETVIRVQPDEEWLADRVGRHIAGHRDHIAAQALRDFAHELQALALAAEQVLAGCTHEKGCHQAERSATLADISRLAYEKAAALAGAPEDGTDG